MLDVYELRYHINDIHLKELYLKVLQLEREALFNRMLTYYGTADYCIDWSKNLQLEINWLIFMESDH